MCYASPAVNLLSLCLAIHPSCKHCHRTNSRNCSNTASYVGSIRHMAKYIIAWKNKTLRLPSFARILFNDVRLCFVAVVTEI